MLISVLKYYSPKRSNFLSEFELVTFIQRKMKTKLSFLYFQTRATHTHTRHTQHIDFLSVALR